MGRATKGKLNKLGIFTIGDIANAPLYVIENALGKNGISIWENARGYDSGRVVSMDDASVAKSIGKSVTCSRDLKDNGDVWRVLLQLSDSISRQLRETRLTAGLVQIYIRMNDLESEEHQMTPSVPVRSGYELAKHGLELFTKHHRWEKPLRTIGIRAGRLLPEGEGLQCSFYCDAGREEKRESTEQSADLLRGKYGSDTVKRARLLYNTLADEVHSDACSFHFMVR